MTLLSRTVRLLAQRLENIVIRTVLGNYSHFHSIAIFAKDCVFIIQCMELNICSRDLVSLSSMTVMLHLYESLLRQQRTRQSYPSCEDKSHDLIVFSLPHQKTIP